MPTSLDVLANDSGGTGTLLIASVGSIPYGVATIQHAMTQGGHDTLLFTPTTGYSGSESFTYTAADAAGDTATATVSVMISGYGSSAPQITSLSSHSGSTSGGTSLTIGGSGFSQVTAVLFGGSMASSFTVNSSTAITAIVPAHSPGSVDVTVVTSMGSTPVTLNDQFTYQMPMNLPTVTSVSPGTTTISGGSTIAITGTNFMGVTGVSFGGTPAISYTVNSSTSITAVAPIHVSGQVDVQVSAAYGTSATSAADQLIFMTPVLPPAVTGLSTASGSTAGGNSITILGTNFTNVSAVKFGNIPATSYVVNSTSSITAMVPAEAAGVVDVTVTNSAATSGTSAVDLYTFQSNAPTVTGLSVSSGSISGGAPVTITGSNFLGVTAVLFGGVPATSFSLNSPTSMTAIVPAEAVGAVDVILQSAYGSSTPSGADRFTFLSPAPTVTGISVSSGSISGSTTVTISGTQLSGATGVLFGSLPAASFVVNADGTVTAVSPTASTGVVDVRVTTSSGTSAPSAADAFTYLNPTPIVSSVTTGGGNTVTISGSYFTGATGVTLGTSAAASFTVVNDRTITAVIPANATGSVDVTVTNTTGTSPISSSDRFTIPASGNSGSGSSGTSTPSTSGLPVIDGLSSAGGSATGGDAVTLFGTGFSSVTSVMFGAVAASSYQINSDNSITAIAPAQTPGTVAVTLLTPNGSSRAAGSNQFTFTSPSALPIVNGVSLSANSTGAGSFASVLGSNFVGVTGVSIGGQPAVFITKSPTAILALVPGGISGTASVVVTNGAGASATSSASQLSLASPAMPNVSQSIPSVTGGDYVVTTTGIPTVSGGTFAGTTGPWTLPTPPPLTTNVLPWRAKRS